MKTRIGIGSMMVLLASSGAEISACPRCRPLVEAGIYNRDFGTHLWMLLPIAVLLIVGGGLYFYDAFFLKSR